MNKIFKTILYITFLFYSFKLQANIDLKVNSYSLSTTSVMAGNSLTAYCKEQNVGSNNAGANVISIHISKDTTLTPGSNGDTYLEEIQISGCNANTITPLGNITTSNIPNTYSGTYYIFFSADGGQAISESDEKNNFARIQITVSACSMGTPSGLTPGGNSANPTTIYTTTPLLQWTSVANANCYGVYIKDVNTSVFVYDNDAASTKNSFTVPSGILSYGKHYKWNGKAQSNCNSGNCVGSFATGIYFDVVCLSPSISSNPSDQSVISSNSANFNITASGSDISYQWLYRAGSSGSFTSLTNNSIYSGVNTSSLYISNSSGLDGYQYKCYVTSTCTANTSLTAAAILTVCSAPSSQANSITFPNIYANQIDLKWTNGNGARRIVVAKENGSINGTPSNAISYNADPNFGNGDILNTGEYIVYSGNGNSCSVYGLTPSTSYTFKVFEYNCSGNSTTYIKSNGSSLNPRSTTTSSTCTDPTIISPFITDKTIANGSSTSFSVSVSGTSPSCQWQISKDNGNNYNSLSNTGVYSNVTTSTLKITTASSSLNGFKYRCKITGACGSNPIYSSGKSLIITQAQNTVNNATSTTHNQGTVADPIQIGTGTFKYKHTDLRIPIVAGQLTFMRWYNSSNYNVDGSLGYGWYHTYGYTVFNWNDTLWQVKYPDGHIADFIPEYNGGGSSFALYGGTVDSLYKNSSGEFILVTPRQDQYKFDSSGRLNTISDPNGNVTSLSYSGNLLDSVIGTGGRSLVFTGDTTTGKINSVKSPSGRTSSFRYDSDNNLVTETNPNGDSVRFTYSNHELVSIINALNKTILTNTYTNHRVTEQADAYSKKTYITYDSPSIGDATVTHPDGTTEKFHHNEFYLLTSTKDALGYTRTYTYDENFLPDTILNEKNEQEVRQYDSKGNLLYIKPPGNASYSFIYNQFASLTTASNSSNNSISYDYDTKGNLKYISFPDGSDRTLGYNSNGTINFSVNGTKDTSYFYYNDSGDITKIISPKGAIYFSYDTDGRLISFKNENGNTTLIYYDNNDNITKLKDALGNFYTITYNADNKPVSFKDKLGYVNTISYDDKGRAIAHVNPINGTDSTFYDVRDRIYKIKNASGNIVSNYFDDNGRTIKQVSALGTSSFDYDSLGNLKKVVDGMGRTLNFTYKYLDKINTIFDDLTNTSTFDYDSLGNPIIYTNPLTNSSKYLIDNMQRMSGAITPNKDTALYTFNNNGDLQTIRDGKGYTQNFSYNAAQQVSLHQDGAGNNYQFFYDGVGNLITIKRPGNITISQKYDAINRLTKRVVSSGDSSSYGYDANNNITSMTNTHGTSYMVYDSLNRLIKYTDTYNNIVKFTYDATGHRTSIVYPNNKTVYYTYNKAGLMDSVKDYLNRVFTYTYDSSGRIIKLRYPSGLRCVYTYDDAGRMTGRYYITTSNDTLVRTKYTLDAVGNRKPDLYKTYQPYALKSGTKTNTYTKDNILKSNSINNFTTDSLGNRTSQIYDKDTILFNPFMDDLLTGYKLNGATTTFEYNPLGIRTKKTSGGNTNKYITDINSPLAKVLQITDNNGTIRKNYIYGLGLLEQIDSVDNAVFYLFDGQHNTAAIVNISDSILAKYAYDPYGVLVNRTGTITQPFTFLGEYGVEQETNNLYYIRARYYDAASAMFISKDPLMGNLSDPYSLNRYTYGMGNPLSIYDITGLFGEEIDATALSKVSVGQPGTWESLIPIWGSGRAAIDDFQNGRYGWAVFNTAMAISDVFLVKSIVTGVAKGGLKMLSKSYKYWGSARSFYGKEGFAEAGQELHHWFLKRNGARSGEGLNWWLKTQMWNLMPMESQVFHQAIHGVGPNAFNQLERLWYGTPIWFKAGLFGTFGDLLNQIR